MQLARFLNTVFKKDGFILVDANSKSYIIGIPKSKNIAIYLPTDSRYRISPNVSWLNVLVRVGNITTGTKKFNSVDNIEYKLFLKIILSLFSLI